MAEDQNQIYLSKLLEYNDIELIAFLSHCLKVRTSAGN